MISMRHGMAAHGTGAATSCYSADQIKRDMISSLAPWSRCDYILAEENTNMETYVRARIDAHTKERATAALNAMGLSVSDAIRLLLLRVADERRLPFEVKVPNATTRRAIAELEAGKGKSFDSVEELMADLNADD